MRRLLASIPVLLLATQSGEALGQYAQPYAGYVVQSPVYAYPARPVEARGYQTASPAYTYQYARRANPTGYRNRPYYGAYGYGFSSNGSTDGFPPFRGRRWR